MLQLTIPQEKIEAAREYAKQITSTLKDLLNAYSSVTIERTVLRLLGIDGALADGTPLPNFLVDQLKEKNALDKGAAYWISNAMVSTGLTAQEVAENVKDGKIELTQIIQQPIEKTIKVMNELTDKMLAHIKKQKATRDEYFAKYGERNKPSLYVIVATGNIYEDALQARAAAKQGADIIAVIRSTAQSLLDYVPYGATTEGFGGTFATQENFRIMRKALDEVGEELNRYISLTNYASGLCMPEIAAMGAMERLDLMLNDAMYGILFRDINPQRTLLDQYFSRMINAIAGIEIQTGEDNYLTTSDAIEKAYTVTASQLINESFAHLSGVKPEKMGIGHAFEIDPTIENSFMYELSHALLTKTLFPDSPIKYMPPTKHVTGNIFEAYVINALFNMVAQMTGQGVQLLGMLTEAVHTPHLADRALAIDNAQYVFNAVKDFNKEISIDKDGFINKRAEKVLDEAIVFLKRVAEQGFFNALEKGEFADIKRTQTTGKGLDGVFRKSDSYINPFMDKIKQELNIN
ncbi:MAG: lysine 5,6-aminomutase subunit alpha [Candidatus Cloacimonadales bacterium]|mgnify:CR=1 FL=1|nr:lysine 5,6-aminomutase subunit alpha [Candidatus Cloacimonadota bacterium]MDD2650333.1 lysine 5,6-aminomutase subunit alpha [Candidatus Cloacimonadota bacterium]MDX9976653.1 lysine 5,6-aminomutase subunit alpha [Candidatus Cloacimonadales bacterium]